jgi:hypothetical protein
MYKVRIHRLRRVIYYVHALQIVIYSYVELPLLIVGLFHEEVTC